MARIIRKYEITLLQRCLDLKENYYKTKKKDIYQLIIFELTFDYGNLIPNILIIKFLRFQQIFLIDS